MKSLFILLFIITVSFQILRSEVTEANFLTQTSSEGLPYRMFIPSGYSTANKYPLVIFLHGGGERGTDNIEQLTTHFYAPSYFARDSIQSIQKSIVIVPHCPGGSQWNDGLTWKEGYFNLDELPISVNQLKVVKLIDKLIADYSIDTTRLYIYGLSMGGFGTWDMIMRYPKRFAAAIILSGGGDTTKASLVKDMPIRIFHGATDATVYPEGGRWMAAAMAKVNAKDAVYKEFPNTAHDQCWRKVFGDASSGVISEAPGLARWTLAQQLQVSNSLSLSTSEVKVASADNSKGTFDITSNTSWTVNSNQEWLTVSSDNGSNNATITVTVSENTTSNSRSATVTVTITGISKTITVTQNGNTSAVENKLKENVNIYPNPFKEKLYIKQPDDMYRISLKIFNLNGKMLYSDALTSSIAEIDLSGFSSGIYFAKLQSAENIYYQKIIKN
jgi:predicted esterase